MMEALCPLPPYAGWYCRENFDLRALHYKQIEGDYDIFGDGAVVILHTPGHTNGHQSVVVRLKNSGTVILTISTGYVKQSLEQGQLTGYFYNADDQYRSVTRLREIHQRENALVVADHDPDADELYKFVPDYYD